MSSEDRLDEAKRLVTQLVYELEALGMPVRDLDIRGWNQLVPDGSPEYKWAIIYKAPEANLDRFLGPDPWGLE